MRFRVCLALAATAVFGCGAARSSSDAGGPPADGAMTEPYGHDAGTTAFPPDQVSGTRLRARAWVADDGTRQVDSWQQVVWFDSKLGTPCSFSERVSGSGELSCEPVGALPIAMGQFVDAACQHPTQVALSAPAPMSLDVRLFQAERDARCGPKKYANDFGDVFYELGAPLADTVLYSGQVACEPRPGAGAYPVGRKIDPSEFVTAHVERVDTGHRLSTIQLVAADGARQRIGWYDNVLATECHVGIAADGMPRCLPSPLAASPLGVDPFGETFADATCTMRVGPLAPFDGPPSGAFATAAGVAGDCGLVTSRYYRIGKRLAGDLYFLDGTSCMKIDPRIFGGAMMYSVEEVPPAAMDGFDEVPVGGGRLQVTVHKDAESAVDVFPFGPSLTGGIDDTLMDTALNQRCRFEPTADGLSHCLPAVSPQMQGLNCSRNVVVATKADCFHPESMNTAVWRGDACTGGLEVSAFGATIMPGGGRVGDCTVFSADPNATFYEIGATVPPSTFEAAKLVVE